jgi:acyl-CoA synthetase (AMP-forming)/AMP-acid ligase II
VTATGRRLTFNLADLLEIVVDTVPGREALVAGGARRTFAELDERANRIANHLLRLGLEPGAKVAIYGWNRAEWVETFFGAFKARLVPININYRYVADELRYIFENADIEAVVVERSFLPLVRQIESELPKLSHVIVLEDGGDVDLGDATPYEDALIAASDDRPALNRSGDDLYILYTGGTTGTPKGVMWRHEDIFFAALGGGGFGQPPIQTPEEIAGRVWPEESRVTSLTLAPIMHGAAQWGMCIMLFGGGKVVLYTPHGFDPHEAWVLAERERAMTVMVVGDAMARPLGEALDQKSYDLSSVVSIGSGGAVYSAAVKAKLKEHLPNVLTIDTVGASELGASGSQQDPDAGPRFNTIESMSVLGEDLRPVEPGSDQVGLLARRGHIPLGYYKDEAKTAATFVTDPDGVRWSIPGDHARIEADGTISLLGRGSGCINTGGEKVYPEEVEAAVKSHPDVFDVVVVGVPDARFTERVAAIVQPRTGRAPSLEDVATHCRTTIAGYKVPRELKVVDAIQRTPSGKADYRWAKQQFETERAAGS